MRIIPRHLNHPKYGKQFFDILLSLGLVVLLLSTCADISRADDNVSDHNAIVLEDHITYKISKSGKAKMTVRGRVKVLNAGGKKYGSVLIWESKFIKLKKFKGRVYDSNDQILYSLSKKDGERVCGYAGYALYSDDCYRTYQLSASSYPFIAEYEYEVEHSSIFFWPAWTPQSNIPVLRSTYELIVPKNLEFRTWHKGDVPSASISEHKGKLTYSYEMRDIAEYDDEDYAPPIGDQLISLRFSPKMFSLGKYDFDGDSWHSLGKGLYKMMDKCFEISEKQKELMENIQSSSDNQKQICEKLHEAMTAATRYVAIEVGIGGWRPSLSKETFDRGYGDCKDLATMYASMLKHVGIEAYTTLILTRNKGVTYSDFPNINSFNHAILFAIADGDTLWIDPTYQQCAVGDLPQYDEDTFVLTIDSAGGQIIRTPVSIPEDNIVKRKVAIDLSSDKSANVSLSIETSGNQKHQLIGYLNSGIPDVLERLLRAGAFGLSKKFKADSINIIGVDDSTGRIIQLFGKVRQALYSIGEKRHLDLRFFEMFRDRELTDLSDRRQALDLEYPQLRVDTMIISLPVGWQLQALPVDTVLDDQFGTLRINYKQLDGKFLIARQYQSFRNLINVEDFGDYKAHISRVKAVAESRIVMTQP